jgi:hypothetical protein
MTDPPMAIRVAATLLILLNVDVVLSIMLTAGYGLTAALAATAALGTVTAEIIARLLSGNDPGMPPSLPWQQ